MKSIREVMERVRVTRSDEEVARAAAEKATTEREAAERALGPAEAQARANAAALSQAYTKRIKSYEAELEKIASRRFPVVLGPSRRARARAYLHSSDPRESGGAALLALAESDGVVGELYGLSQSLGELQMRLYETEDADPALMAAADATECRAWSAMQRRILTIAGEDL